MPCVIPVSLQTEFYTTLLSGQGNNALTHPTFGQEKLSLRRGKNTLAFELPFAETCVIGNQVHGWSEGSVAQVDRLVPEPEEE